MASADTTVSETSKSRTSFLVPLWQAWLQRRERERVRQLAYVRFRLTREGVHFVGILIFVFIGAVIRDISLLILLAGAMIGLLLLQWRFNTSTLIGLGVSRSLPRHTAVGQALDVELSIRNPKRWLGAWLVLVQDRIQRMEPSKQRITPRGTALLDAVRPRSIERGIYRLRFSERGAYSIGPTTLSTRFPLGLGQGWRTIENTVRVIVHPAQGALKSGAEELFHLDQMGQAKSSARAGSQEGEFFGLRPWATGDSKRWIHWRTTARLGQLSVRQFEQQQKRRICVVLDLCATGEPQQDANCEQAISFLATLATQTVQHGRDKLSVGVAADRVTTYPHILSPLLVTSLLDDLAIASATLQPPLGEVIRQLSNPILANPFLIVISTRSEQSAGLFATEDPVTRRLLSTARIRWVNVAEGELEGFFQWT